MTAPTISPVDGSTTEPWGGHAASEFQSDIVVSNGKISGDVTFVEGGLAPSGYLSGDGYFLFLKWDDVDEGADSLLVGLQPSQGSGLVEAIDDPDKNVVLKIKDNNQKFVTIIGNTEAGKKTKTVYELDLNYLPADDLGA